MSEEPVEERPPEEAPAEVVDEVTEETETASPEGETEVKIFDMKSILVAGVSFVVVIIMVIVVYSMTPGGGDRDALAGDEALPEPPTVDAGEVDSADAEKSDEKLINVPLLVYERITTSLPPHGDRGISYEYSITVRVPEEESEKLKLLLDPEEPTNRLGEVKEIVRIIIKKEDYMRLREEKLSGVKRLIKQRLNALIADKEVIREVVFDVWNVIP